jgi:hypothetical protein
MAKLFCRFLVVLCVIAPAVSYAGDYVVEFHSDRPAPFDFEDFGFFPDADMLCIGGPCLDEDSEIYKRKQSVVSYYHKPVDITQFGGVRISSPRYEFFKNSLFEISFNVVCDTDLMQACLDYVEAELSANYDMVSVDEINEDIGGKSMIFGRLLEGEDDVFSQIVWQQTEGVWDSPSVKIFRMDLLEELRSEVDSDFVPIWSRWKAIEEKLDLTESRL